MIGGGKAISKQINTCDGVRSLCLVRPFLPTDLLHDWAALHHETGLTGATANLGQHRALGDEFKGKDTVCIQAQQSLNYLSACLQQEI